MSERTDKEIDEQIDLAVSNPGRFSSMTYEEGVRAGLEWIQGLDEKPMED